MIAVAMTLAASRNPRNSSETKGRILAAAQAAFSEQGYSQTGMREVAERAGVAHSLILRYFGTKANLFANALNASFSQSSFPVGAKPQFGQRVVEGIDDPTIRVISPGMVALALGDDEARKIAAKVLAEQTTGNVAQWLGGPDSEVRATKLVMLAMGYSIFSRLLDVQVSQDAQRKTAAWMASTIQGLVDAD
jgi:AcrR family transcriptional regulator